MDSADGYLDLANPYWQDGCAWGLAMGAITGGVGGGSSTPITSIDNVLSGSGGLFQTVVAQPKTSYITQSWSNAGYTDTYRYRCSITLVESIMNEIASYIRRGFNNVEVKSFTKANGDAFIGIVVTLRNGAIYIFAAKQINNTDMCNFYNTINKIYPNWDTFYNLDENTAPDLVSKGFVTADNTTTTTIINLPIAFIDNIPFIRVGTSDNYITYIIDVNERFFRNYNTPIYGVSSYNYNWEVVDGVLTKITYSLNNTAGGTPGSISSYPDQLQNNFNGIIPIDTGSYDMENLGPYNLYNNTRCANTRTLLHRYSTAEMLMLFYNIVENEGFIGYVMNNDLFILGKINDVSSHLADYTTTTDTDTDAETTTIAYLATEGGL